MFKTAFFTDEFTADLEKQLNKFADFGKTQRDDKLKAARGLMVFASEILDANDKEEEAEVALELAGDKNDALDTKGLTSEKMLKNLAEKGWVFNED